MVSVFGVNISDKSYANADFSLFGGGGLKTAVWGWTFYRLKNPNGSWKKDGLVANSVDVGDYVVFGWGAQNPRLEKGSWDDKRFNGFAVGRVLRRLYEKYSPLWPDEDASTTYPYCLDLEIVHREDFSTPQQLLGGKIHEGLRSSGVQGNRLVKLDISVDDLPMGVFMASEGVDLPESLGDEHQSLFDSGRDVPPTESLELEEYDRVTTVTARREQAKLRKYLFSSSESAECALCGRVVPVNLLRAAHIKKRESCGKEELGNLSNVMSACVLGCDELFERGYVFVDGDGYVRQSTVHVGTSDLEAVLGLLKGRRPSNWSDATAPFFEYHRSSHLGGATKLVESKPVG